MNTQFNLLKELPHLDDLTNFNYQLSDFATEITQIKRLIKQHKEDVTFKQQQQHQIQTHFHIKNNSVTHKLLTSTKPQNNSSKVVSTKTQTISLSIKITKTKSSKTKYIQYPSIPPPFKYHTFTIRKDTRNARVHLRPFKNSVKPTEHHRWRSRFINISKHQNTLNTFQLQFSLNTIPYRQNKHSRYNPNC